MDKIPNLQNSAEKVITFHRVKQSHRYKAPKGNKSFAMNAIHSIFDICNCFLKMFALVKEK